MPTQRSLFSHAATILPVKNVTQSVAFYRNQLGFNVTFTWGDPVEYAVIKRGEEVSIHLIKKQEKRQPSSVHGVIYIFVHDVDKVYHEYQSKHIKIVNAIADRDYSMRDFDLQDIDGHIISIGRGISH
ncbi:MAG: VOC family protein [Bacteroidota bacterium]